MNLMPIRSTIGIDYDFPFLNDMSEPLSYLLLFSDFLEIRPNVLMVLGGMFLAMVLGSVIRLRALHTASPKKAKNRVDSLKSWWTLFIVFALVIGLGRIGGIVFMAILSFLGLREFIRFLPQQQSPWRLVFWAYVAAVLNYVWIYLNWLEIFVAFIPIGIFLFFPARMLFTGNTRGFLRDVAGLYWGLLLVVFCLSHAAYLFSLPPGPNPQGGATGWFLYLVVLTETNDITQALWGRRFGKHKLTPRISPNKTREGFFGGFLTTIILAIALAPLLTPFAEPVHLRWSAHSISISYIWAVMAGLIITLAGLLGDLTMSAVKRDAGVKDSGALVPGQGGILDRIDSLTFTAPLFFYFVYFLYY